VNQVQTLSRTATGRKCGSVDLKTLTEHFQKYCKAVNLILERVYSNDDHSEEVGEQLSKSRSRGYVVLMNEHDLKWDKDNEFGKLVFGRMHRNALEAAARIILADHTRRGLVRTLVRILVESENDLNRLMKNKRVPADLIRRVRDQSETKRNGSGFHYALSACKQVRRVLDELVLSKIPKPPVEKQASVSTTGTDSSLPNDQAPRKQRIHGGRRGRQRVKVRELWKDKSKTSESIIDLIRSEVTHWNEQGFPFMTPVFRATTEDFSASTENTTGQGYWFRFDPEHPEEIIVYIKTPPGLHNNECDPDSPYKSHSLRFRFLNWFPRKVMRAKIKAVEARTQGDYSRARQLEFRAAVFADMSEQLMNTIALHHVARELTNLKSRKDLDTERIVELEKQLKELRTSRRSAPPRLQLRRNKVILSIPFLSPDRELLETTLEPSQLVAYAGVDRGIRFPIVVSVRDEHGTYHDRHIGFKNLFAKRERLRHRTRELSSQIDRRKNNWEKKHPGLQAPAYILKKEMELASVWRKVRRLDREISHLVASETVWFCEKHGVKTIYFEDLRSFQGKGGMHSHSWRLSTNLWGLMIEGVRYRRQAMGHRRGGVWTVNPAWTSQTCSRCGERGVRVERPDDTEEMRGGEHFFCPHCQMSLHADVNAARNIIKVKHEASAVPGRTGQRCPTLSKFQ
jgi:transposase